MNCSYDLALVDDTGFSKYEAAQFHGWLAVIRSGCCCGYHFTKELLVEIDRKEFLEYVDHRSNFEMRHTWAVMLIRLDGRAPFTST